MDGVFPGGGDLTWVQATAEAHSRAGPFGRDTNLAWPQGYRPWSVPQLGAFFGLLSWLLGATLGLPSAMIVWVILVAVAAACTASTLYFFRTLTGDWAPVVCVSMACAMGASPFVLGKIHHLNVASYFILPLAIGAAISWSQSDRRRRRNAVLACAAVSLLSPLWWVIVAIMVLCVTLLPALVRRSWVHVRGLSAVSIALLVGFGFQSVLYQVSRVQGAAQTRSAWDSNIHGGHLADLVLASPILNEAFPRLQGLTPGASVELSHVGLVAGIGSFAALALVIIGMPRLVRGTFDASVLASTTVAALLLFLLGGLGNLQAAVFFLLGGTSPARAWSRLIVLLGMLGLGWLLLLFSAWARSLRTRTRLPRGALTAVTASVALVIALSWAGDAMVTPRVSPAPKESWAEYPAVHYLETVIEPCPVAQLPQDGFPQPRLGGELPSDTGDFRYRGLVPYLLAPGFSWSFGSWVPGQPGGLNNLPRQLEPKHLSALGAEGYCAVLFDKQLAKAAATRGIMLEGVEITGTEPDFASPRFDVFLLH